MNNKTRNLLLALVAITGAALAQQVSQNLLLSINGKNSSDKAVILGGKTYYPESALKTLGVTIKRTGSKIALTSKGVAGGANQMAALEGCVGETLFNGALRVKLHGFEAFQKDGKASGWTADLEFRNGTQQVGNLYGFGSVGGSSWYIAYDDASTYPFYITGSNGVDGARDIPPGSSYRTKFNIEPDTSNQRDLPFDATRKPVKLLLGFSKSGASNDVQKLLTADPSFRIRLDCKK
jgi:hypothetical protein